MAECREVQLNVNGYPPAKDGGSSIFDEGHPQHHDVVLLWAAAQRALDEVPGPQWNRDERRPVGLELGIVEDANSPLRRDPINCIGGVADVLQSNPGGPKRDLKHKPSLYFNDEQIREVRLSVQAGDAARYLVRVWLLDDRPEHEQPSPSASA